MYHQLEYSKALHEAVPDRARWLDLGSGRRLHGGWGDHDPATIAPRARYIVGCDLMVEHMRQHPHLTHRVAAIGEHLPFADQSFDVITACMVLEHLPDPVTVFREVHRLLAVGGRFIFVTPNRTHPIVALARLTLQSQWRRTVAQWVDKRPAEHVFPTFYRANTPYDLARLCYESGLDCNVRAFLSQPFTSGVLGKVEAWLGRTLGWQSNLIGVFTHATMPAIKPVRESEAGRIGTREAA